MAAPASAVQHANAAQAQPTQTNPRIIAAFVAAFERATAERLVAYKVADGVYEVPGSQPTPYTVRRTGLCWFNWSCTCAGGNHLACKHRAVALYAAKHGIHAVRQLPPPVALDEVRVARQQARIALVDAEASYGLPGSYYAPTR